VMPAYNEVDSIEDTVRNIVNVILNKVSGSRLIVIDDGSHDGTEAILDHLASELEDKVQVFHQPNRGHGPAIYLGIEKSSAEWIFLVDSDNQIELSDFYKLWGKTKEAEILMGKRVLRHDPLVRLWLSKLIRHFLKIFLRMDIYDANVPFKLFKRQLWLKAQKYIPPNTLAPSLFLAVVAKKLGYRMIEIEVRHYPRRAGQSSLKSFRRLLGFCAKALVQLWVLKKNLKLSTQVVTFAGVKVDNVTLAEAVEKVDNFLALGGKYLIVTPNPEIIVACQGDHELKEIINSADLRLPDGISMVVVSRILGPGLKERVTGIDLMLALVKICAQKGYKIFLLGGKEGIAEKAAQRLTSQFPALKVVGTHHGYFSND
ncbi:MAG: WecB/TagA/CpsF family glycosyltransferase, partial [Candidatus Margulisiibacteriota bacterium]